MGETLARASRGRHGPGPSGAERHLPSAGFVLAAALLVGLFPSILRPPPQTPPASAEFSPDAPPDQAADSIVAALGRGTSSGAGAGAGAAAGGAPESVDPSSPAAAAPTAVASRACPRGYGVPPRQTESLYAAPCASAFVGDNGGATYKGVTASEVRVALAVCTAGIYTTYNGPQSDDPPPSGETTVERTYRIFQRYFNANFQFYGRHLTFVHVRPDNCLDSTSTRASAVRADEEYRSFGYDTAQRDGIHEGVRRKMVVGGVYGPSADYFAAHQPYLWGWQPDGTQTMRILSEFLCKQLAGRTADFTDDPSVAGKRRVFGLFFSAQFFVGLDERAFQEELGRRCGERYARIVPYTFYTGDGSENFAGATLRMRADGVTTVVCFCDYLAPAVVTNQATQEGWFPEWVMPGTGEMDVNAYGALADSAQWRHALGFSALQMPMALGQYDYYRAYKSIDPAGTPDNNVGRLLFEVMLQWANGIQMAGPNLRPETFMEGLGRMPSRPPDPVWAAAGGFGPGDHTYLDYVTLVWWDPNASPPENPSARGAYRYLDGGRRYRLGELPLQSRPFFREGITEAPSSA